MRRNMVAGLALAVAAAGGVGAATVLGSQSQTDVRPPFASVEVQMTRAGTPSAARAGHAAKASGPKVVYLGGSGQVNTAETGPYVDFGLKAAKNLCPRVLDGGIRADNLDFFQQGSYIEQGRYHVLMGLDDAAKDTPVTIPYTLHVVCLKGTR